jgi:hypothetical protein
MNGGAALRPVPNLDFARFVIVRKGVAPASDRHPENIRQSTGILLDLNRPRLTPPDDPTE